MCSSYHATPATGPQRGRHRTQIFLVALLGTLSALLILLSGCEISTPDKSAQAAAVPPIPLVRHAHLHLAPTPTITTMVQTGHQHLYPVSQTNIGLMQPAVDSRGNVWVGEMHVNRLGLLNTHTGVTSSWQPPDGEYGIMTTAIDEEGMVWFAEQNANSIGRFDPRQHTFVVFPLGSWQGSPLQPHDLHLDGQGSLWFTAVGAGAIGRLSARTGTVSVWPIPAADPSTPSFPSSLTILPDGQLWFGAMGMIGSLDPATSQMTLYELPNTQAQVFAIAADPFGRLCFTEVLPGKLGMFDPLTATLTELAVPVVWGRPPALYSLVVDRGGEIWFVDVGADTLVRYTPDKQVLTFLRLSLPGSAPFGLTQDPAGKLWFTAGGSSANAIAELTP